MFKRPRNLIRISCFRHCISCLLYCISSNCTAISVSEFRIIFMYSIYNALYFANVVGAPVEVEKNTTPSQEELDELHIRYIDALVQLFEDNKEKYGVPKEAKLQFV